MYEILLDGQVFDVEVEGREKVLVTRYSDAELHWLDDRAADEERGGIKLAAAQVGNGNVLMAVRTPIEEINII